MKQSPYTLSRQTYSNILKPFDAWLLSRNYAADTVRAYTNYAAFFLEWLSAEGYISTDITYNELLCYIDYCTNKGDGKTLINRKMNAVRMFYDYLLHNATVQKNPAVGLYIMNKRKNIPGTMLNYEELSVMYENYQVTDLRSQRNKVMIGLLVFQGVTSEELEMLEIGHIKCTAGKIEIPGGRQSNSRILPLEAVQILDIQQYITITRPQILKGQGIYGTGRKPDSINKQKAESQLFISMHGSDNLKNSFLHLLYGMRRDNPKLINARHIRQSVITNWLTSKNLRQVQYMAGHRYVSSTERYRLNNLDALQEALNVYHPLK